MTSGFFGATPHRLRPSPRWLAVLLLALSAVSLGAEAQEPPRSGPGAPRSASPLFGNTGPSGHGRAFPNTPSSRPNGSAATGQAESRSSIRRRVEDPARFETRPGPFEGPRERPPRLRSNTPREGVPEVDLGLDDLRNGEGASPPRSGQGSARQSRGGPSGDLDSQADREAQRLLEATEP